MPARVSALNSVDLPTLGKPTMPHLRLIASFPSFLARVQRHHGALELAGGDVRPAIECFVHRAHDRGALRAAWRLEHVIHDVLLRNRRVARVADAEAQPPEFR